MSPPQRAKNDSDRQTEKDSRRDGERKTEGELKRDTGTSVMQTC